MDLQTRLENIKRDNDRKKEEKNRIEGRLDSLKQQMKEQYQCETIEELKEKIDKLAPEIEAQEADIIERLEKMEQYAN